MTTTSDKEWENFNKEMDEREAAIPRYLFEEEIASLSEVCGIFYSTACIAAALDLLKQRIYRRQGWL